MLTDEALEARIAAQQSDAGLYPLEHFCRGCGNGHLAAGRLEGSRCRRCDRLMDDAVIREHPVRAAQRARREPTL